MRKITNRAFSVLIIAALVMVGMLVYLTRYIDSGEAWAMYFTNANSKSTGEIVDRNGTSLAFFSSEDQLFASDELTRIANYHVTGDYVGRAGSGILSAFWSDLHGFSLFSGTTQAESSLLKLNIDSRLNNIAYQALGEENSGAVLICNYRTGELLCMVSAPSVDPMNPDEDSRDGVYINRCLSAAFTPGSVFKLITAAAAIENIPDIYQRSFTCYGSTVIGGVQINCSGTHYDQTFEQALSNSCNCAFAQIGVTLGQDAMIKYVRDYGFLDSHSLDGITTAAGSYPLEFVGDPELAWSGIGQSTDLVCPYSLLRYVCAIANDGILCEPRLINSTKPPVEYRLINADTAEKLKQMMNYNVVTHYNGETNFPGLALCAKTGTAELGDGDSHAWFTGFLLDDAHPYAFVTLVERGGGGLSVAGSISNTILQQAVELN